MRTVSVCVAGLMSLAVSSVLAQVTSDRLVNAAREPGQWLMYSGSYDGSRYSPLDQINRSNVQRLSLQACSKRSR